MKIKSFLPMFIASVMILSIMPGFASDTLGIFGNANLDDTIDEKDIAYVNGVFNGTNAPTNFSDANYDGKVDSLDVVQIEMIISGEENELTFIDSANRTVTLRMPLKSLVAESPILEPMRSLALESEEVVGITQSTKENSIYFPELNERPSIGSVSSPDYEAILKLHPDTVWIHASMTSSSYEQFQNKLNETDPTITVLRIDGYKPSNHADEIRKMGYILGKREEVNEFLDFYEGVLNTVEEKAENLSEKDKPTVYFEYGPYKTCGEGSGYHEKIVLAGGNNIFSDLTDYPTVDAEEVVKRNPDIIILLDNGKSGYESDNATDLASLRDEVMNRPELADVTAVKEGQVYAISNDIYGGSQHFLGIAFLAKWFHPSLFEGLDPKVIHQEYLTRFQGLDYDLDEHGAFIYPPLEEN